MFFREIFFSHGISANIQNLRLQKHIEHVFSGNQVGSRSWEFQVDVFLVRLLFCQSLHLVAHFLVHLQQTLQLLLLLDQFISQLLNLCSFQPGSSFVVRLEIVDNVSMRFLE